MTEYESATLVLREWALWAAVAQVVTTLIVGAAQIAIVAYGIRAMRAASDKRAHEQDQRHHEAMKALNTQSETLSAQSSALTALVERTTTALNAQSESLSAQSRALSALVERTAPARP